MQIIFSLMPFLILANFAPAFLSVILEDFVSDILDLASDFPGLVRSPPWPSLDLTAFSGRQLIVCAFVLFLGRPCLQYPRPCLSFPWPSFPWPCTWSSLAFARSHRRCDNPRTTDIKPSRITLMAFNQPKSSQLHSHQLHVDHLLSHLPGVGL